MSSGFPFKSSVSLYSPTVIISTNNTDPATSIPHGLRRSAAFSIPAHPFFLCTGKKKPLTPVSKPFYFDAVLLNCATYLFETAHREDAIYECQVFLGRESIQDSG
jgi:hypothetical protein